MWLPYHTYDLPRNQMLLHWLEKLQVGEKRKGKLPSMVAVAVQNRATVGFKRKQISFKAYVLQAKLELGIWQNCMFNCMNTIYIAKLKG